MKLNTEVSHVNPRTDVFETLQNLILSAVATDSSHSAFTDVAIDEALRSIDSMGAMRLIILIRDEFDVEVAPVDLFLCENVRELSELLRDEASA